MLKYTNHVGLILLLLTMLTGCMDPKFLEDSEKASIANRIKLRPTQGYTLSYEEELISVKPRIRSGLVGKTTSDYQSAPVLLRYEKSIVVETIDSLGNFYSERTFVNGTYDGNNHLPKQMGEPDPSEIQLSETKKGSEVIKIVMDNSGTTLINRAGETKFEPIPAEIENIVADERLKYQGLFDSLHVDSSNGISSRMLESIEKHVTVMGGTVTLSAFGILTTQTPGLKPGSQYVTKLDTKTGNTIQEVLLKNGRVELLTQYNYVNIGNRWFESRVYTRLFDQNNHENELLSETIELRSNFKLSGK